MTKWYLIAVVAVVTVGVGAIAFLDSTQPKEVNVELANKIIGIITAVLPVLLLQLNNAAKIDATGDEVKAEVKKAKEEAPIKVVEKLVETGSVPAPTKGIQP